MRHRLGNSGTDDTGAVDEDPGRPKTVLQKLFTRDLDLWLRRVNHYLVGPLFAGRWGKQTQVEPGDPPVHGESEESLGYEPSSWLILRLAFWGRRPGMDDVFIDIGSGKGRVVLQAARFRFRRVIGLERSERLTEIARANLDRNSRRLTCQHVELLTADIRDFEMPDDVSVVFCFNSVKGALFQVLLDRISSLADRRGRTILFIYYHPTEVEAMERSSQARLVKSIRPFPATHAYRLNLYEIAPFRTTPAG